jgi:hypothetical protein
MGELDDDLSVGRKAEVGQVDAVEPMRADASRVGPEPVGLTAGAEAGRRGEEGEERHEEPEGPAERMEAGCVGDRCTPEDDRTDGVGETRRTRVLDGPFADERLHELEIRQAGEAPAASEREPDRELRGEEGEQRPPAGHNGDERERADHRLVETRGSRVDDVEVPVRVSAAALHFLKRIRSPV